MARMFKIIEKDWYKRRTLTGREVKPVHVAIPDYQQVHNHICNMIVSYDDNSIKTLIARVLFNELNQTWTVDGMEVAVTVIEDVQERWANQEQLG
ncbi:hypothetical protein [Thalassotalea ganghwensis]